MPQLGLTDTLDLLMKAGTAKADKLAAIKHRPPCSPAVDFYRGAREAIVENHAAALAKAHIISDINASSSGNARKAPHYETIATNYARWWGKESIQWLTPPRVTWSPNGVAIAINPELGLTFDGQRHIVKLRFKDAPISRKRCALALELMNTALNGTTADASISVLDVRRRRLHTHHPYPVVRAQLNAEAAWIATLWPHV